MLGYVPATPFNRANHCNSHAARRTACTPCRSCGAVCPPRSGGQASALQPTGAGYWPRSGGQAPALPPAGAGCLSRSGGQAPALRLGGAQRVAAAHHHCHRTGVQQRHAGNSRVALRRLPGAGAGRSPRRRAGLRGARRLVLYSDRRRHGPGLRHPGLRRHWLLERFSPTRRRGRVGLPGLRSLHPGRLRLPGHPERPHAVAPGREQRPACQHVRPALRRRLRRLAGGLPPDSQELRLVGGRSNQRLGRHGAKPPHAHLRAASRRYAGDDCGARRPESAFSQRRQLAAK